MYDSQGIETGHKRDLKTMTQFKVNTFIKLVENSTMFLSLQENTDRELFETVRTRFLSSEELINSADFSVQPVGMLVSLLILNLKATRKTISHIHHKMKKILP